MYKKLKNIYLSQKKLLGGTKYKQIQDLLKTNKKFNINLLKSDSKKTIIKNIIINKVIYKDIDQEYILNIPISITFELYSKDEIIFNYVDKVGEGTCGSIFKYVNHNDEYIAIKVGFDKDMLSHEMDIIQTFGNSCNIIDAQYFVYDEYIYTIMNLMDTSLNILLTLKEYIVDFDDNIVLIKIQLMNSFLCMILLNYNYNDIHDENILVSFEDNTIKAMFGDIDSITSIKLSYTLIDVIELIKFAAIKINNLTDSHDTLKNLIHQLEIIKKDYSIEDVSLIKITSLIDSLRTYF